MIGAQQPLLGGDGLLVHRDLTFAKLLILQ